MEQIIFSTVHKALRWVREDSLKRQFWGQNQFLKFIHDNIKHAKFKCTLVMFKKEKTLIHMKATGIL